MSETFIPFRKIPFSNKIAKKELEQLLTENNIPFEVEENTLSFDASYANNEFSKDYNFKIKQTDLAKVTELLQDQTATIINELPADYYLYSFTSQELREVIFKPDEWNEIDVMLAKQILSKRGEEIPEKDLKLHQQTRFEKLSLQRSVELYLFWMAYATVVILSVFSLFARVGSLFVLFIVIFVGFIIKTSKKTLPNGERIYTYDDHSRKHAYYLSTLGIIGLGVAFIAIIVRTLP